MVALSFYGIFHIWKKILKNSCYKFFAINSFALLQSNRFNLHVCFRSIFQTIITEMRSLIRKEKIERVNCGTQTTRNNTERDGTLYCTQRPNFSTTSQDNWNYHIPQNLSFSSVNFDIKSLWILRFFINIKTPNMASLSRQ